MGKCIFFGVFSSSFSSLFTVKMKISFFFSFPPVRSRAAVVFEYAQCWVTVFNEWKKMKLFVNNTTHTDWLTDYTCINQAMIGFRGLMPKRRNVLWSTFICIITCLHCSIWVKCVGVLLKIELSLFDWPIVRSNGNSIIICNS